MFPEGVPLSKRIFDLALTSAGLVILSPVLLLLAVWVRLAHGSPVLFTQVRPGHFGRPFKIYKFRSMRVDAQARGPQITVGEDARITRSGALIRKYKIDEFPQFINVLFGDMSLVGPRPEVPRYVGLYPPDVRDVILSVRPGITDLASIAYRDESDLLGRSTDPERTYVEEVLPAKLALCERYVRERSFFGDLAIIGRSMRVSFSRQS